MSFAPLAGETPSLASSPVRRYIQDEEKLDLGFKKIDENGAKRIAKELETNTTITLLELGGNKIGDAGVASLAHALATRH
jgi:Leucine Rich repeat